MTQTSTYTFGILKRSIYKLLGEYSSGGEENTFSTGFAADMEKQLISVVNRCMRRIILSFPLLTDSLSLTLENLGEEGIGSKLPDNFGKLLPGCFYKEHPQNVPIIRIRDGYIYTQNAFAGDTLCLQYEIHPKPFSSDADENTPVSLPDTSADALAYLAAAELCPTDAGELYSRLMFKYRDLSLNCYNSEPYSNKRNSFFGKTKRRGF